MQQNFLQALSGHARNFDKQKSWVKEINVAGRAKEAGDSQILHNGSKRSIWSIEIYLYDLESLTGMESISREST